MQSVHALSGAPPAASVHRPRTINGAQNSQVRPGSLESPASTEFSKVPRKLAVGRVYVSWREARWRPQVPGPWSSSIRAERCLPLAPPLVYPSPPPKGDDRNNLQSFEVRPPPCYGRLEVWGLSCMRWVPYARWRPSLSSCSIAACRDVTIR